MGVEGGGAFPDLTVLCRKMDLQEAWESTFTPGYKAEVRGSLSGGERSGEALQI